MRRNELGGMRRLAILRPEPGASATVARARALGLEAFAMPLFVVEPVAWEVPSASEYDALLLTSANAVRHGGAGLRELQALPAYAVGEATAAAAREAELDVVATGDGGVERLLDDLPAGLRLLHLCGEHRHEHAGRNEIQAVPVYRAIEAPPPGDFQRIEGETAAVHSPRAGRRLAELVDRAGIDRGTIRIAAISADAAGAAGAGWEAREAAAAPDDASLLALAARLCDNPVTT